MITTKARCQKLPSNDPAVPVDRVSFHSKDSVHKWKYDMQRPTVDEWNI